MTISNTIIDELLNFVHFLRKCHTRIYILHASCESIAYPLSSMIPTSPMIRTWDGCYFYVECVLKCINSLLMTHLVTTFNELTDILFIYLHIYRYMHIYIYIYNLYFEFI